MGSSLAKPTMTGSAIAMYVPTVGTNWATRPVHMPSGSQYGMSMNHMNNPAAVPEMTARVIRAAT